MGRFRRLGAATLLGASGVLGSVARAQTITPRTVPVLMSEQFELLPAVRAGMASVTIALNDELLDPFSNPAMARRVPAQVSIAPYVFNLSASGVGARTLPVSGTGSFGQWAVGGLVATQQLDRARPLFNATLNERTASNRYLQGLVARQLNAGTSVGLSAYWSDLDAEQGIDQLYAGSDRIGQRGTAGDVRLGLVREWKGSRVLELVALRSHFDMTHEVHFPQFQRWTPPNVVTVVPERAETYRDRTITWGTHVNYSQPIGDEGWRVGFVGTVNRMSHPGIPDYRIGDMITVPRDPGHTWAYNAGVGLAHEVGRTTLAADLIVEPMFSTTWAEAARDTVTVRGAMLLRGAHTVNNDIRFFNMAYRFGLAHDWPSADSLSSVGIRLGLRTHETSYRLRQWDLVRDTSRVQDEHWMEWTPTFGFRLSAPGLEFNYTLTMTCGAGGDACLPFPSGDDVSVVAPTPGGVIASPTDAIRYNAGRATLHRFAFTLRGGARKR